MSSKSKLDAFILNVASAIMPSINVMYTVKTCARLSSVDGTKGRNQINIKNGFQMFVPVNVYFIRCPCAITGLGPLDVLFVQ